MTTISPEQKRNKSSSETALFDEESNLSLEVEMARKANKDASTQSSERRHQQEFSKENSASTSDIGGSRVKVALACDWLTTPGGAEKVLLELHKMYPEAPIYTSQYSKKGINWFDDADVRTGWLQIFPRSLRKFLGPLRQLYFSHLDLSKYDLVISVTGAEAKSIRTTPKPQKTKEGAKQHSISSLYHTSSQKSIDNPAKDTYHLCYCHVPTQYYWQMYDKYVKNPGFGFLNPLVRLCLKLLVKPLSRADYKSAQRPDQFVTISNYAKDQIKQYYDREAIIVAPPVEVKKFLPDRLSNSKNPDFSTVKSPEIHSFSTKSIELSTTGEDLSTTQPQVFHQKSTAFPPKPQTYPPHSPDFSTKTPDFSTEKTDLNKAYFIIACRQVTWKRVDLAIQACQKLNLPLKVVGDGSEHQNLVKLAAGDPHIEFIPWVNADELAMLLQNAQAYIFPSLEPFGVAAVEALAAGCPVIALAKGGSQDFIKNGENGLLFNEQTVDSLIKALKKFQKTSFDRRQVSQTALRFAPENFRQGIKKIIKKENL